jgi:diguanylate cyclase (GGDEF)-like protein
MFVPTERRYTFDNLKSSLVAEQISGRSDDPLFAFRVRATLILLPLVSVAAMSTWWLLRSSSVVNIAVSDLYLLPLIAVIALGATLWLALDSKRINTVLLIALGMLALYELVDLATTFVAEMHRSGALGHGAVWFAVVTVMAFIVLPDRSAVRFGIVYNAFGLTINLISFFNRTRPDQLNGLLQFHAANVSVLIILWVLSQLQTQYVRVERLARTDSLTGLLNRRSLQTKLARGGALCSVVMFDVDFFKRVNDLHGHSFGDEVLREIAFTLSNHAPSSSSLARWGGEEFMLLLPDADAQQARACAVRLCDAVKKARPGGIDVTLSAGVAQCKAGESKERLIERADEALYRVKESGRNRATVMD